MSLLAPSRPAAETPNSPASSEPELPFTPPELFTEQGAERVGAPSDEPQSLRFPAFRHRAFRLFWTGNVISLVGTLAQDAARNWLSRLLTQDEFKIGLVAACGTLPILVFSLLAGPVADRTDKRRGLMLTNALSMMLAVILGVLVWKGLARIWNVAFIALLVGTVNAFDIPIRQSFNREMVGRDDLTNAIALNSAAFNGARVLGPAVGGALLRLVGTAGCFFTNAFSYLAVIYALFVMKDEVEASASPPQANARATPRLSEILDGARWVRHHETVRLVMVLCSVLSIFAMSFSTLLAVFARDVFGVDERGYALLLISEGAGAFGSAASLAVRGDMKHRGKRVLVGAFGFSLAIIGFAFSPVLWMACLCVMLAGWLLFTFLTTANTLVQTLSPDDLRGRIFSIYSLCLIGVAPFGSLFVGGMAKWLGPRGAVGLGGAVAASVAFGVYILFPKLWKER